MLMLTFGYLIDELYTPEYTQVTITMFLVINLSWLRLKYRIRFKSKGIFSLKFKNLGCYLLI